MDALPRVAEVHALAMDAPPRVAAMHALAMDAPPRVAAMHEPANTVDLDRLPWAIGTRPTPSAANPAALTPDPPAGNFGIEPFGVTLESRRQAFSLTLEPDMPGMQVVLIHGPPR